MVEFLPLSYSDPGGHMPNDLGLTPKEDSEIHLDCILVLTDWWHWLPWRKNSNAPGEGLSVVLEATVKSTVGTPAGTVTFWDGNRCLGTRPLMPVNDHSIATMIVSGLTWGIHSIVASYSGDDRTRESTSPVVLHRVKHEWRDLKHIWSSAQSFFTILALIAAGYWAVQKWYIEREPSLEMTVVAYQDTEARTRNLEFIIRGNIAVKNVGTEPTMVKMGNGPLFVARVESIPSGAPREGNPEDLRVRDLGRIHFGESQKFWLSRPLVDDQRRPDIETVDQIRPGGTDVFYFIVRVQKPGIYAILFSPGADSKASRALADEATYPARWEPPAIYVDVK